MGLPEYGATGVWTSYKVCVPYYGMCIYCELVSCDKWDLNKKFCC